MRTVLALLAVALFLFAVTEKPGKILEALGLGIFNNDNEALSKLQADVKGLREEVDLLRKERKQEVQPKQEVQVQPKQEVQVQQPEIIPKQAEIIPEVIPKQEVQPKVDDVKPVRVASVRIENETAEAVKIKINESLLVDVGARQMKFVTVPAGRFTYQVIGVHSKAITNQLDEGQVYGLPIREQVDPKTPPVDPKTPVEKTSEPKLPNVESSAKLGRFFLYNKHAESLPFCINGVNYYVNPGEEVTVVIPVGVYIVVFPGWHSNGWFYDVERGKTYKCGAVTRIVSSCFSYVSTPYGVITRAETARYYYVPVPSS